MDMHGVHGSRGIWSRSRFGGHVCGQEVCEYRLALLTLLGVDGRLSSSESGTHSRSPNSRSSIVQIASFSFAVGMPSLESSTKSEMSAGTEFRGGGRGVLGAIVGVVTMKSKLQGVAVMGDDWPDIQDNLEGPLGR